MMQMAVPAGTPPATRVVMLMVTTVPVGMAPFHSRSLPPKVHVPLVAVQSMMPPDGPIIVPSNSGPGLSGWFDRPVLVKEMSMIT